MGVDLSAFGRESIVCRTMECVERLEKLLSRLRDGESARGEGEGGGTNGMSIEIVKEIDCCISSYFRGMEQPKSDWQ